MSVSALRLCRSAVDWPLRCGESAVLRGHRPVIVCDTPDDRRRGSESKSQLPSSNMISSRCTPALLARPVADSGSSLPLLLSPVAPSLSAHMSPGSPCVALRWRATGRRLLLNIYLSSRACVLWNDAMQPVVGQGLVCPKKTFARCSIGPSAPHAWSAVRPLLGDFQRPRKTSIVADCESFCAAPCASVDFRTGVESGSGIRITRSTIVRQSCDNERQVVHSAGRQVCVDRP